MLDAAQYRDRAIGNATFVIVTLERRSLHGKAFLLQHCNPLGMARLPKEREQNKNTGRMTGHFRLSISLIPLAYSGRR